jgi:thymidylate synthase (FAD)
MVKLVYVSPLWLISNGIRQSHANTDKADSYWLNDKQLECPYCGSDELEESLSQYNCNLASVCRCCKANLKIHIGEKDYNLIKRVGFQMKHESVLEHSLIVFEFEASRALLQELSRHRIGVSPTVKSTRYTLKELKNEKPFADYTVKSDDPYDTYNVVEDGYIRAAKYVTLTGNADVDESIVFNLEELRSLLEKGVSNDVAKYALPEAFKFKGQYSFNLRSLMHLLKLRLPKEALKEFRLLSKQVIDVLPPEIDELVMSDPEIRKAYIAMDTEIRNEKKGN